MGKFFTKGRIACLIIFSVLVIDNYQDLDKDPHVLA